MRKEATYVASADVARRAGVISSSYRTADGRYILAEHDLRSVRLSMTPEEYVTGLDVEIISDEKAKELIKANNYAIGEPAQPETHEETVPENVEPAEETEEEPTNEE